MNRVWAYVTTGGTLLAGSLGLSAGCTSHNNSSVFVFDVLASKLVSPGQQCAFTSDPTQPAIPSGELDVALSDGYVAEFLLANQLVPQGNPSTPLTETSYAEIQGAVVTVTKSDGTVLNTFTRLSTTTIPPSTGGIPSYSPISVLIVDPGSIAKLTELSLPNTTVRVVASVYFFGVTLGNEQIQSNTYEFPVDICKSDPLNGSTCLVQFTAADVKPGCGVINCLGSSTSTAETTAEVPCTVGQDLPIDCSQCLEFAACNPNQAICAGTTTTPTADGGTP